ncbi:hypothetical protein [Paenibacillus nasutitermitis]|uniref:Uncharacterized protein n=1 Tax=Paenibacillus nasutitermitis TaxID=1652958 RepID=A0A916ZKD8_9BACL|nr:hypothetical protein [Paenibacillus nasutitermitis]GGE02180.1 hypothetical protein GCM10010911_71530 [Paenibacillus nasutitermitis]
MGKESPHEVRIGKLIIRKHNLEIDREVMIHPDQFQLWDNWRIDLLLDENQEKLRSFQQAAIPKENLDRLHKTRSKTLITTPSQNKFLFYPTESLDIECTLADML